jgi:hypothetical protein
MGRNPSPEAGIRSASQETGTWFIITAFSRVTQWGLCWGRWIQSISWHYSIWILSLYFLLNVSSVLFFQLFLLMCCMHNIILHHENFSDGELSHKDALRLRSQTLLFQNTSIRKNLIHTDRVRRSYPIVYGIRGSNIKMTISQSF